jgi:hypothetical protein
MKKRNLLGSAWGSILAMRAGVQAQEAAAKPRVVKTEQQLRQEEFDRIKAEHDNQFVTVEVESTPYERSISGQATKQIEVNRADYEKRTGITDLRNQWSKEPAEIQALAANPVGRVKFIDSMAKFPISSTPVELTDEDATEIVRKAKAFLDSKNLSESDRNRVVLFASIHVESNSLINSADPSIWQVAYDRLATLGCIAASAQAQAPTQPVEQSADELLTQANAGWFSMFGEVFSQWVASLGQAPWNFVPDRDQKFAALKYLEATNMGDPQVWNNCRVAMSDAGIFPSLYTADDLIVKKLNSGEWDLSTPAGRASYARAKNQISFGTI